MAKDAKYTIFKTKWGYFGLAANEKGLLRSCLPCPNEKIVKRTLLVPVRRSASEVGGLDSPKFDKNLLKSLQNKIIAYFEGKPVHFTESLDFTELTPFIRKTLAACKKIQSGKTITYSQLAAMIGKPKAGRAVGNALAKNPIPLLIPCHRVIRRDGSPGNFSAPGGSDTKKKLLTLEKR
jgi:methylated-DNA-[protein]-cysteine S-methyltransferase